MLLHEMWIYTESLALADRVHSITRRWDSVDRSSLGIQLIRAADSVGLNIAEGYGRYSTNEFRRFLLISRGSLFELLTQLELARRRGLISINEFQELSESATKLIKGVVAFSKAIEPRTAAWSGSTKK
jgi:four helix bundle protein